MMHGNEEIIKSQQMLKCPYDPNHNVPKETFFKHLDKCKSPYKDLYVQCPFNPFHYPRKQKQLFRKHCRQCPQRLKWAQLEASKSEQYEVLLEPEFIQADLAASVAKLSLTQGYEPNNQAITRSWLGNGLNQSHVKQKEFEEDDSQSIYLSQVEKSKIMAQSQVWHIPENVRSNESIFMSQMKRDPYAYSQYGGKFVPPPPTVYSQYSAYQYPRMHNFQYPHQMNGSYNSQQGNSAYLAQEYMRYQKYNGHVDDDYNEQEVDWEEQDSSNEKKKKQKKEKKEKKEKKQKKQKKTKSGKSDN